MADSMKHKARRGSYSMLISFAVDTCGPFVVSRRLFSTTTEVTPGSLSKAHRERAHKRTTGPIRRKQIKNVHAEYVLSERF